MGVDKVQDDKAVGKDHAEANKIVISKKVPIKKSMTWHHCLDGHDVGNTKIRVPRRKIVKGKLQQTNDLPWKNKTSWLE